MLLYGVAAVKCIIPIARSVGAGQATNGPGTNEVPYLLSVAGKPLIGHLVDQLLPLKPEEIIFILGHDDRRLIDYLTSSYKVPLRFIQQKEGRGSAHALFGAKKFVSSDVLILFGDTFFEADLANLSGVRADGIIWTSKVADPRELGVVFKDGRFASKLIEKPDEPISTEAMIGLYYLKDAASLFSAIKYLFANKIKTNGLYTLTDALQVLINQGVKIAAKPAAWIDADHGDGLFRLHERLLAQVAKKLSKAKRSVIIEPVYIGKGAIITDSVIGPNVSIGVGSIVSGSIIRESIVCTGTDIVHASLKRSVVGTGAVVRGHADTIVADLNERVDL